MAAVPRASVPKNARRLDRGVMMSIGRVLIATRERG
jgi:hypothetical protein